VPAQTDEVRALSRTVLSFDICSSSNIIEDLTLTNNVDAMHDFLLATHRFLRRNALRNKYRVYKFTGDGWILLFREGIVGRKFFEFLTKLSLDFQDRFRSDIAPVLEHPIDLSGLTFGADRGQLLSLKLADKAEYIGRPLNIACRLQSAIGDRDRSPAHKVLLSKHLYRRPGDCPGKRDGYRVREVSRTLRNIRGGTKYRCIKVDLPIDGTRRR